MLKLHSKIFSPFNLLYAILLFYMVYHILFSSKGLFTFFDFKERYQHKQEELKTLQTQMQDMELEIYLLNDKNLSNDIVEEKARAKFNMLFDNEIVILKPVE